METQMTLNSQSKLEKENWSWRNQPSSDHQDSTVLAQNWNMGQLNKIESPEVNPCTYGHVIFGKGGKKIQWRKHSLFNKWCWEV